MKRHRNIHDKYGEDIFGLSNIIKKNIILKDFILLISGQTVPLASANASAEGSAMLVSKEEIVENDIEEEEENEEVEIGSINE